MAVGIANAQTMGQKPDKATPDDQPRQRCADTPGAAGPASSAASAGNFRPSAPTT